MSTFDIFELSLDSLDEVLALVDKLFSQPVKKTANTAKPAQKTTDSTATKTVKDLINDIKKAESTVKKDSAAKSEATQRVPQKGDVWTLRPAHDLPKDYYFSHDGNWGYVLLPTGPDDNDSVNAIGVKAYPKLWSFNAEKTAQLK